MQPEEPATENQWVFAIALGIKRGSKNFTRAELRDAITAIIKEQSAGSGLIFQTRQEARRKGFRPGRQVVDPSGEVSTIESFDSPSFVLREEKLGRHNLRYLHPI